MTKILEINSNLNVLFKFKLEETEFQNFNFDKDVIIIGNFLNDDQLKLLEFMLSKKVAFIYNNLWECNYNENIYELLLKYKNKGIMLNGFSPRDKIDFPFTAYYVPMFFWYNCFYFYPKKDLTIRTENAKKFLMPIRTYNKFKKLLLDALTEELHDSIYSCVFKNIYLPNDKIPLDQSFVNPSWYNNTCFSVVPETEQEKNNLIFLTEKTFKPISIGHPLIIYGNPRSLELLRINGFKTFDKLFDERYDLEEDPLKRLDMIVEQIIQFDKNKLELIAEDIEHNYNLFYNEDLVRNRVEKEIKIPLIEFLNER